RERHACPYLGFCAIALFALASVSPPCKATETTAIDEAVRDVCGKQVVLLGEDANHGSGATVTLKVALVERQRGEPCEISALCQTQRGIVHGSFARPRSSARRPWEEDPHRSPAEAQAPRPDRMPRICAALRRCRAGRCASADRG